MSSTDTNVWSLFDDFSEPFQDNTQNKPRRTPGRLELLVAGRVNNGPSLLQVRDEVVRRLEALKNGGKIPDYYVWDRAWDRYISQSHERNAGGSLKGAITKYERFGEWASTMGASLYPHFQNNVYLDSKSGPYYQFPNFCLIVFGSGFEYKTIFPHSDGHTEYTIDYFLSCLEEEKPWKQWCTRSELQHIDYGPHGNIKRYINSNKADTIGSEWGLITDEMPVYRRKEPREGGFIDLAYSHKEQNLFLFVEVKTSPDRVDKAFGQLKGYAVLFADGHDIPLEQIKLVIAAPQFYDYQYEIAEEWGFCLLPIPI